ncbi:DNA helicase [Acetobacter lambici]|uniref:DNA helicase n=1 Tax=Acetobacter lambici TaxID=1332824 RepID=A0ABT1F1X4_9PROT|nr:helicase-related protein [Acetobacter lambici]MCP1243091.1 DNA helicase [Acetobacter lambici]MCP1259191.1 DNA helicase [Acetobacter lambici]NHO56118.1 DNA helicase [Acetobacter lambici]
MKVSTRQMAPALHATHFADQAPVRAILGPTNTGKTHLALERMLAHSSGIIGFPLRLLARENYDRMVRLKGVRSVALITGEEKIIPPQARWFSCTVEAMPMNRPVDFMAVDEIQLCADPERGHIFTDRLLNARGLSETLFLGADTIAPLMRSLIRDVEIDTRPRLSSLNHTGHTRLSRLPPRTAIVAFSMADVYAIAELIRRKRGGCAVVMGQLSPRTRNAQVALYQNREVDYLVATDAIGMGLNMNIDHVAFAGLSKFDGQRHRMLTPAEIAQIAGRAGRGTRDGTFGTTGECPPLPDAMAEAVETHKFEPLPFLWWRGSKLSFASPQALHASLCQKTPHPSLRPAEPAADMQTLSALMQTPAVRTLATTAQHTRLLWEICQIPDFRKLGLDSHIRLCGQLFSILAKDGRLPSSWLKGRLASLEHTGGEIEDLMHRLMGIRTWSYVAAHPEWVENAEHWQRHTRMLEDSLSDALHERLTSRFVDRRAASLARRLEEADGAPLLCAISKSGEVRVEGHDVGHMRGFAFIPDPEAARSDQALILKAARRAARSEIPRLVARFLQAPESEITLDMRTGYILWRDEQIAHLRKGPSVLHPIIHIDDAEFLETAHKARIRERLAQFVTTLRTHTLAPLFRAELAVAQHPLLRGIVHAVMENGGVTTLPSQPSLPPAEAALLQRQAIRLHGRLAFCAPLFKPHAMALRSLLLRTYTGQPLSQLPPDGAVSMRLSTPVPPPEQELLCSLGWLISHGTLVRLDIAASIVQDMRALCARTPKPLPLALALAARLGVSKKDLPHVLKGLGIRLQPPVTLPPRHAGPPAPFMVLPTRRTEKRKQHPKRPDHAKHLQSARNNSPFAILSTLRSQM